MASDRTVFVLGIELRCTHPNNTGGAWWRKRITFGYDTHGEIAISPVTYTQFADIAAESLGCATQQSVALGSLGNDISTGISFRFV